MNPSPATIAGLTEKQCDFIEAQARKGAHPLSIAGDLWRARYADKSSRIDPDFAKAVADYAALVGQP